MWHPRLRSDPLSDRSTWTCRCPSSSTRPPVRTPTAPAPQETIRCSPTTRCLTSPVFPNSCPPMGWLGHKIRARGRNEPPPPRPSVSLIITSSQWRLFDKLLKTTPHAILPQCFSASIRLKLLVWLSFSSSPRNSLSIEGLSFCHWTIFVFFLFSKWNYIFVLGPVFCYGQSAGSNHSVPTGMILLRQDTGGNEGHWWVTGRSSRAFFS